MIGATFVWSNTPGLGELAALAAALLWAIASVIYARLGQRISPLSLNIGKGVIAIACLSLTLILTQETFPTVALGPLVGLCLSGVIGIAVGDTFYLEALRALGARLTSLLSVLAPPLTAFMAWIFLQESVSVWGWLGIALTLLGVAWVIQERVQPAGVSPQLHLRQGLSFAVLAAFSNATGALLSRAALATTPITPLWGALLRLVAGTLPLLLWLWVRPRLSAPHFSGRESPWTWQAGLILLAASFLGTYLGIWLQQVSLKYTEAGIAQTLGTTSPLFILGMAALMGKPTGLSAWFGSIMAIAGVGILLTLR